MAETQRRSDRIRLRNRKQKVVPRGVLFLHNETRRRENRSRVWFGIFGRTGTGKNTLATRFNVLHRNELRENEVIARNFYELEINLNNRPAVNRNGLVHVGILIYPASVPGFEALLLVALLRAIILLFDVNENGTLTEARTMFEEFGLREDENRVPSILVGNKIDIRDLPRNRDDLPPRAVSTVYGASIARSIGILEYYECSALRNIGAGPILDRILQLILR